MWNLLKSLWTNRTCYRCHRIGNKRDMCLLGVPDGITDIRDAWFHKECAKEHIKRLNNSCGPITELFKFASGQDYSEKQ